MAVTRRRFIASTAAVGLAGAAPKAGVSLVVSPTDQVANAAPAQWAAKQLETILTARGVRVRRCGPDQVQAGDILIAAVGANLSNHSDTVDEGFGFLPQDGMLIASSAHPRGLMYALLELADRVENHANPRAALAIVKPFGEGAETPVRGITRMFVSDVEDKPWFNDREMWPRYLTMLATHRFNRFHLALGIGYDFIRQVTDAYFLFSYPFLLNVPGYNVRVPQLPDAERDRNLEMLRFISEQTVACGMQFQLGLWMHGYEWIDSPKPNYTIEGLTRDTHGPYCRDAVRMLLKACPAIGGVTFRVHGESGVEEGSYDFWKTVFEGVSTCGRKVELDMHSKGMDQTMLDMAVATGLPVRLSPKFWAEHMGMPYHQADIRALEKPKKDATGLMKFSTGSRNFLRYGYGDLLREDRQWSVIHRIWPGTQRLLLWGDPQSAAAYARAFRFCMSDGVDICEPLSFKGRRGSGIAGGRCAYADAGLRPRWDWEKYVYTYRVWGRLLYNPEAAPEGWKRYWKNEQLESALANGSRILPIVTTAHDPSAANNSYWPEMYFNQSLVDAAHPAPYTDTLAPKVFGNVSPLDPQLFSRMNDFADGLLKGERNGKYSPIEVAQWLEDLAAKAQFRAPANSGPEVRRAAIDISIQAGLGRFFAAKFRCGVLYRIHEQTGDGRALEEALNQYRKARAAWAELAGVARGVYVSDVTVGEHPQLRGHWMDRLPAIDKDIASIAERLPDSKASPDPRVALAVNEALARPQGRVLACNHTVPASFRRGQPSQLTLFLEKPASVTLYYRHVNQAESYQSAEMNAVQLSYRATIPGTYTDSNYPLQYYFEVRQPQAIAVLCPGFSRELTNQPYFVIRPS